MVEKTTRRTDKRGKEGSKSIRISEKRENGERKSTFLRGKPWLTVSRGNMRVSAIEL